LRYFTVTRATLLNLFTLRISTLFCMDRLWPRTRWPSTLSDTFFHFFFFTWTHDLGTQPACSTYRANPPHFSKNFGLAFWLAGGRGLISFSPNKRIAFIYRYHSPLLKILFYYITALFYLNLNNILAYIPPIFLKK
jgi:hypothetical protein